jgi:hypothetical protein
MGEEMSDTQIIDTLIARFRSRLRFSGAVKSGLSTFIWGAVIALLLVFIAKFGGLSKHVAAFSFAAIPAAFFFGLIIGWKRSYCSGYSAAKMLDAHLKLNDRLANAHYFLQQKPESRSPLAALAIEDGLKAAREAKLGAFSTVRWSRRATYGLILSAAGAASLYLLYPTVVLPSDQVVTQETQTEMRNIMQGFQNMPGMSDEQKSEIKDILEKLNISEDEMKKMTSADLMRMMSAKGIEYKGGGGAKAFEAMKDAIADLDQIRQQREEIERRNKEGYQIVLSNGQKVSGVRIATQAPSEQIVRDRVSRSMGIKSASESEELEQLQKQSEMVAQKASAARKDAGLKDKGMKVDAEALLATDDKYKKDRDKAIDDPKSEAAMRVKKANRDLINRELEKGEIPSEKAEFLKNWERLEQ